MMIGVQRNAPGAKGPCFDHACYEVRSARAWPVLDRVPTTPVGARPPTLGRAKWRWLPLGRGLCEQLQRRLWVAAKRSPGRRFHALYDRIWRDDVLLEAWSVCVSQGGRCRWSRRWLRWRSTGSRGCSPSSLHDLRVGDLYRPAPVRRVEIPEVQGGVRPLGIPVVRDPRVCPAGGAACVGARLRAGFSSVLVWVPAAQIGCAGQGADHGIFRAGYGVRGRRRHPRLLLPRSITSVCSPMVAERVSDRRVLQLVLAPDGSGRL